MLLEICLFGIYGWKLQFNVRVLKLLAVLLTDVQLISDTSFHDRINIHVQVKFKIMKRFVIILSVSVFMMPVFSQEHVNIPDPHLLSALIQKGVDTDANGKISVAEAEAVTKLNISRPISNPGLIEDLTGLEAFRNLTEFTCYYNRIKSIDVSELKELRYLWCSDNQITDLDVSQNLKLEFLYCYSNPLGEVDVSMLSALERFSCGGNGLNSLDVTHNPNLIFLDCW